MTVGFFPFRISRGEKAFVCGMIAIGIDILWIKFLEPYLPSFGIYGENLWIGLMLSLLVAAYVAKKG